MHTGSCWRVGKRPENGSASELEMQVARTILEKPISLSIVHQDRKSATFCWSVTVAA